jgi:hypothetical protein
VKIMKTTLKALAIALALSARLIAPQAHAADFGSSINDARAAVSTSSFNSPYSQADKYTGPNGFPLAGWSQLKQPNE